MHFAALQAVFCILEADCLVTTVVKSYTQSSGHSQVRQKNRQTDGGRKEDKRNERETEKL